MIIRDSTQSILNEIDQKYQEINQSLRKILPLINESETIQIQKYQLKKKTFQNLPNANPATFQNGKRTVGRTRCRGISFSNVARCSFSCSHIC